MHVRLGTYICTNKFSVLTDEAALLKIILINPPSLRSNITNSPLSSTINLFADF